MAKKIIITIDGWSSCGKSTLAKQLAKELGYAYIDSGAMYRAITLYFLRNHIDWTDSKEVITALQNIHIEFHYNEKLQQSRSEFKLQFAATVSEAKRLRLQYPRIQIVALLYQVENNLLPHVLHDVV